MSQCHMRAILMMNTNDAKPDIYINLSIVFGLAAGASALEVYFEPIRSVGKLY